VAQAQRREGECYQALEDEQITGHRRQYRLQRGQVVRAGEEQLPVLRVEMWLRQQIRTPREEQAQRRDEKHSPKREVL
jgi:hypothetical protein